MRRWIVTSWSSAQGVILSRVCVFSEGLCWVSGEGVGNTEVFCVVVGILNDFEVRFCSVGGVGSVVGVGGGVYLFVEFSMIQCLYVCVDGCVRHCDHCSRMCW